MRILQDRHSHGNVQSSGISYNNQRKRIHILLPEMRPAISTKKEEIELTLEFLKAYSLPTVSRQLDYRLLSKRRSRRPTRHPEQIFYFKNEEEEISGETQMGCWKWFDGVLKEAGIKMTVGNKDKIDDVIHHYIGEQSSYGHCSKDWKKARKEIAESAEMKEELIEKLRKAV
jgi:hypothetical protein